MDLILASASPRRSELLTNAGYVFSVSVSNIDESAFSASSPAEMVKRLATEKARAVARENSQSVVLGCDTVVVLNGKALGKPADREQAKAMLHELSGKQHTVFTGVCAFLGTRHEAFVCKTEVEFYPLTQAQIDNYVATGEPMDKAGAYGIQGFGSVLVRSLVGDYFTVMGLPIAECSRLLSRFGVNGRVIAG